MIDWAVLLTIFCCVVVVSYAISYVMTDHNRLNMKESVKKQEGLVEIERIKLENEKLKVCAGSK